MWNELKLQGEIIMRLTFKNMHNETRLNSDFDLLSEARGTIEFKKQKYSQGGLAVVYAPNGTGKSSFASTMKAVESTEMVSFEATDEKGNVIVPESKAFHVIEDQISRHIILGDESQYLVGQNIKREYELRKRVGEGFAKKFQDELPAVYKEIYNIGTVKNSLINNLQNINANAYEYIRSIVNKGSRGKNIDFAQFVEFIENADNRMNIDNYDENLLQFIIKDFSKAKVVEKLLEVDLQSIGCSEEVIYIEQHDDAIGILNKYHMLSSCIVCDNQNFNGEELLSNKKQRRNNIYNMLNDNMRNLLDQVINDQSLVGNDPFRIKQIGMNFISGKDDEILILIQTLKLYVDIACKKMINELIDSFIGTTLLQDYKELSTLQASDPEIDSDDLLYIQKVISENIDRNITIIRDQEHDKNFRLMIDDSPLLNVEREEMRLSTGEQNFISLAFELLLAKNSSFEYIIIDDPISSFDSLYKNKIAFCIIKFLENKKQIVLTHNLDLVRLLEVQLQGSFNLYLLNNTEGGENGFIKINEKEKQILINLAALISLLQNKDGELLSIIIDRKMFLMAMIPFLRGYTHISFDPNDYYGKLSNLMHGYKLLDMDLVPVYNTLFGNIFDGQEMISSDDILNLDCRD